DSSGSKRNIGSGKSSVSVVQVKRLVEFGMYVYKTIVVKVSRVAVPGAEIGENYTGIIDYIGESSVSVVVHQFIAGTSGNITRSVIYGKCIEPAVVVKVFENRGPALIAVVHIGRCSNFGKCSVTIVAIQSVYPLRIAVGCSS